MAVIVSKITISFNILEPRKERYRLRENFSSQSFGVQIRVQILWFSP
jgi:hypothetical protein